MREKIVFINTHIKQDEASEALRRQREENTRYVFQLMSNMTRIEVLLDKAYDVINDPEGRDFVEEVPALISELYLNYLRISAIRQRLDADMLSEECASVLSDVWATQAAAAECLDILSDLFDEEGDFGEDEDGEADDGEEPELEDDILCLVDLLFGDRVTEEASQRIVDGVNEVVTSVLADLADNDSGEPQGTSAE